MNHLQSFFPHFDKTIVGNMVLPRNGISPNLARSNLAHDFIR